MKSPWFVACDFNHYTAILTLRLIILMAQLYNLKDNILQKVGVVLLKIFY